MSTLAVARKDFEDARRSRVLQLVTSVFVVFAAGTALFYGELIVKRNLVSNISGELTTNGLIKAMTSGYFPFNLIGITPVHVFLPFVGLLLGYGAIVSERESGQIKLLLSLPHSRAEVVVGKLAGRASVAVTAMVVGFVAAAVVGALDYQQFSPAPYLGFILATALLVLVFVSIGIGISAAAPTKNWALAGVIAYLTVFHALWGGIFVTIGGVFFPDSGLPNWLLVVREFNPARAYNHVLNWFVPGGAGTVSPDRGAAAFVPEPVFLSFMAFWIVAPVAVGYLWFDSVDL